MDCAFENMCRTCMNEGGNLVSINKLYNREERVISYAEMLSSFMTSNVDDDTLPRKMCQNCVKQLLVAYSFKQICESSYATLLECTKDPNIEYIKENVGDVSDVDVKIAKMFNSEDSEPEEEEVAFEMTEEFLKDEFAVSDSEDFDDPQPSYESLLKSENYKLTKEEPENAFDTAAVNNFNIIRTRNKKLSRDEDIQVDNLISNKKTKPDKCYTCQLCNKKFAKFQTYQKHKKFHSTLKCTICDKVLRSLFGLRYHMQVHNNIRNYKCTFENCNKRFRLKQALKKHLSVHNKEPNHLCMICGKTYATYDSLHYHLRNHRGERPYLCIQCGKTFKQSSHLKNHMWNHTGIKPYKCKTCGKRYTTGFQLSKHSRKYCNNPAYQSEVKSEENVPNPTFQSERKVEDVVKNEARIGNEFTGY